MNLRFSEVSPTDIESQPTVWRRTVGAQGKIESVSSAPPIIEAGSLNASGGGKALAGFMLSGFLLALLGAILPAWGYHRDPPDFVAVGNYFLSLAAGIVAASVVARSIMARRSIAFLMIFACAISCLTLIYLAFVAPPQPSWLRMAGLFVLGIGAGLLNMSLFYAISARYHADAAGTVNLGGVWYGLGCMAATILVAAMVYSDSPRVILVSMASIPAVFAVVYARVPMAMPAPELHPTLRQALADFRSVGAIMFALLLFFQFGNEWSIAGWLPVFLLRRISISADQALVILAFYWLCLMGGRLGAVMVLPRVRHGRLLMGSVAAALFGCCLLYVTDNVFGAAMGVFFLGCGYASIFPLVAEAIGRRFPYYHPGFFNGIFSLALLGGLLAPATLGYAASALGVGVVVGIPLIGTCLVMVLLLLIWLESKVTGR